MENYARFLILFLIFFAFSCSCAQAESFSQTGMETSRIVVFKDGYCMFEKKITCKVGSDGEASIEKIPEAMVLGSFWVIPKIATLTNIIAQQKIVRKQGNQHNEKNLLLHFCQKCAGKEVDLTIIYLCPGIRWIPTYRLLLGNDNTLEMGLQAEILNEAEDLKNVKTDLVVGVPNFKFKDVISPLSLEATLRNSLHSAAPNLDVQSMSNMRTQRISEFRGQNDVVETDARASTPILPQELEGKESQDLFVYSIPSLSLKAGERAAIPILSSKIPFRHIYSWDVLLNRSGAEIVSNGPNVSPIKLLKNEIWHQVELKNSTGIPWTTGAAIIFEGLLPLGQELLTYTSAENKCQIPITIAIDIRGTFSEEEVSRDLKAIYFDNCDYVKIAKRGTLKVNNFKKEPVDLIVSCELGGNATKISDNGKIAVSDFLESDWRNFRGSPALNGHSKAVWNITLAPGASKELNLDYYYYAR